MEAFFCILGTLLGSFMAWLTSDRRIKMQATLELHREFNSGEVLKSGRPADRAFAKHMDKTYDQFSYSLRSRRIFSHLGCD
jgi:hypothetical protein